MILNAKIGSFMDFLAILGCDTSLYHSQGDDDDDDEWRINFSVALSPKTTRTRNNKPKQWSHVMVVNVTGSHNAAPQMVAPRNYRYAIQTENLVFVY